LIPSCRRTLPFLDRASLLRFLADALTCSRLLLAIVLVWLGTSSGPPTLTLATGLIIAGWTADTLDGHLANWAGSEGRTLLGRHDVTVDMIFSLSSVVYFVLAGFVSQWLALTYVVLAAGLLMVFPCRSLAIIAQAPAAALPGIVGFIHRPVLGVAMVVWAVLLLLIDRRRFTWRLSHFWKGLADLPGRR